MVYHYYYLSLVATFIQCFALQKATQANAWILQRLMKFSEEIHPCEVTSYQQHQPNKSCLILLNEIT